MRWRAARSRPIATRSSARGQNTRRTALGARRGTSSSARGASTSSSRAPGVVASGSRAPGAPASQSRWILKPWQDLLLFVGTPALVLPVALVGERLWTGKNLYAFVMAFGALGHHLPGMMRAYGDRALFARFRTRFIVAPLFLVALCVTFALRDPALGPIVLLTYLWGVWHGLMQTHGFLRIYDAKVRSFATRTARLDQWMCITWFGAGMLFSSNRMHHVLQKFYASGGPLVPFHVVHDLSFVWGAITAAVTAGFLLNLVHEWRAGRPPSPVKLGLLATSLAFWWYSNAVVGNILVGLVLFEMFHDVQYLAIVWTYNRKRVQTDAHVGGFTRFVFRERRPFILLYVGLVFAYGALSLHPKLPSATVNTVFTAILAASTLLHFYYDSFIWKVKEKPTRAALGLEGGQDLQPARGGAVLSWGMSGLRWAALVVPAIFFGVTQAKPSLSQDDAMLVLGKSFPNYPLAQNNLATYLMVNHDYDAALQVSRHVLALRPDDPDLAAHARDNLFWGLIGAGANRVQRGRSAEAEPLLREAAQLDPGLVPRLADTATQAAQSGDHDGALVNFRMALLVSPADARLHLAIAQELYAQQRVDEAIEHARQAHDLAPSDPAPANLLTTLEAAKATGG